MALPARLAPLKVHAPPKPIRMPCPASQTASSAPAGIAVQDAFGLILFQQGVDIGVGLPVVDDDGFVQLQGQTDLPPRTGPAGRLWAPASGSPGRIPPRPPPWGRRNRGPGPAFRRPSPRRRPRRWGRAAPSRTCRRAAGFRGGCRQPPTPRGNGGPTPGSGGRPPNGWPARRPPRRPCAGRPSSTAYRSALKAPDE